MIKLNWKDPKTLLYIAILLVVITVIFIVIKNKLTKTNSEKLVDTANSQVVTSDLSYSPAEYLTMCDQLQSATGLLWNDSDIISAVFAKIKSKSDWYQLISSFGVRSYSFGFPDKTLIKWLDSYLSTSERKDVNNQLSKINISI